MTGCHHGGLDELTGLWMLVLFAPFLPAWWREVTGSKQAAQAKSRDQEEDR